MIKWINDPLVFNILFDYESVNWVFSIVISENPMNKFFDRDSAVLN